MIILGIDPALNQTGYAIIIQKSNRTISLQEAGIIKNTQQDEFPQKLLKIFKHIDSICQLYKPNLCGLEETFLNVNPLSSLKLSAVRGTIITSVTQNNIPIFDYSPNKIKKTVTGSGKAEKSQVEFMIQKLVANVPNNLSSDEYDAISIAFTCLCFAKTNIR